MSNWHDMVDETIEESPSNGRATYRERFGGEAEKTLRRSNEVEEEEKSLSLEDFELPLVDSVKG